VLITGSGPEDRDEAVFGHRPFLVLADHLTRKGVASCAATIEASADRASGRRTRPPRASRTMRSPASPISRRARRSTPRGSACAATAREGSSVRSPPRAPRTWPSS
jgi:hypothetical protein